jgi:hypothetical protein
MIGRTTRQHKNVVAFKKLFANKARSDDDAIKTSCGHCRVGSSISNGKPDILTHWT